MIGASPKAEPSIGAANAIEGQTALFGELLGLRDRPDPTTAIATPWGVR